jgi:hypothetical protein
VSASLNLFIKLAVSYLNNSVINYSTNWFDEIVNQPTHL